MKTYTPSETALVLIDVQKGFTTNPTHYGTSRSTPNLESNIATLLAAFRKANTHIFHVCHHSEFETSPLQPSKDSVDFMPCATPLPFEPVFPKSKNSAFVQTKLEEVIRERGIKRLVIAGLTTQHCVSTSVRMASNLGVVDHAYGGPSVDEAKKGAIVLVSDATAAFSAIYGGREFDAETVHAVHLACLKDEFCDVESTEEVVASLDVA